MLIYYMFIGQSHREAFWTCLIDINNLFKMQLLSAMYQAKTLKIALKHLLDNEIFNLCIG